MVEEMKSEQRVALVIGNGANRDLPLRNPPNDARAMARALRECGFRVAELIDDDRRQMVETIQNFGDRRLCVLCSIFSPKRNYCSKF